MRYGSHDTDTCYSHFALQEISVNNSLSQDSNAHHSYSKVHYLTVALIFSSFITALIKFRCLHEVNGATTRKVLGKQILYIYLSVTWKLRTRFVLCSCCEDPVGTVDLKMGQISREINREPLKMTEITITPMPYHHSQDVEGKNEKWGFELRI